MLKELIVYHCMYNIIHCVRCIFIYISTHMIVFLVSQFTEPKLSHYGIETSNDHSQSVSIEWERDTEAEQSTGPHSSALTMSTIHTDSDPQSEDTENPICLSQSVTRKSDCDSPAIPSTPSPLLLKDDEIDSGPTTTNITVFSPYEHSVQSNNARQSHDGGNVEASSDARLNSTASPILARWSANGATHSNKATRTPPFVQQVYTQFIHVYLCCVYVHIIMYVYVRIVMYVYTSVTGYMSYDGTREPIYTSCIRQCTGRNAR